MTAPPPAGRLPLAASAVVGACVGLAIGSAYVAGALARAAVEDAQARAVAGSAALAAPRPDAPAPVRRAAEVAAPAPTFVRADLRGPIAPPRDLECLSQAVYYEARGEVERGREAVAQVVLNRTRHPRFPRSVCGVVFQHASVGCAFAFACDGQTRHALEPAAWREARRVAQRALAGFVLPELRAATDFRSGGGAPQGLERVAQIGGHVFYRWTGRAAPARRDPPPVEAPAPTSAPTLIKADAPGRPEGAPATPAA